MSSEPTVYRTNYLRRTIGIAAAIVPFGLALTSLTVGVLDGDWGWAGLGVAGGGFLLAVVNAHLSFVRPWRYRRKHGSMEGYRLVSGLPVIGTLCVIVANIMGFGEILPAVLGLLTLVLDTGGSPWFLYFAWNDRSFWDTKVVKSGADC